MRGSSAASRRQNATGGPARGSASPGKPGSAQASGPEPDWRDPYGRGSRDPVSGLYEWYDIPAEVQAQEQGPAEGAVTWTDLLSMWDLVEADLH